jgi:hypothetical protein
MKKRSIHISVCEYVEAACNAASESQAGVKIDGFEKAGLSLR